MWRERRSQLRTKTGINNIIIEGAKSNIIFVKNRLFLAQLRFEKCNKMFENILLKQERIMYNRP